MRTIIILLIAAMGSVAQAPEKPATVVTGDGNWRLEVYGSPQVSVTHDWDQTTIIVRP